MSLYFEGRSGAKDMEILVATIDALFEYRERTKGQDCPAYEHTTDETAKRLGIE